MEKKKKNNSIKKIETKDKYLLICIFENGITKIFDLKPLFKKRPIFNKLKENEKLYKNIKIEKNRGKYIME